MKPTPIEPKDGQESVWAYPRPPRLEPTSRHIRVVFNNIEIANTCSAYRTLETSHPPTYYIPPNDIKMEHIDRDSGGSLCEWKGQATYYTITVDSQKAVRVAWAYHNPQHEFAPLKDYLAFYASAMQACFIDDELVVPQPGHFYGGWITSDVVGPFKGEPGSWHW